MSISTHFIMSSSVGGGGKTVYHDVSHLLGDPILRAGFSKQGKPTCIILGSCEDGC